MKLQEFIDRRKECPFCGTALVTIFKTKHKQSVKYEDDRLLAMVDMNGLSKGDKDYKIGYSFGLNDNSVYVEFYSDSGERFHDSVPLHLIEKFWKFYHNTMGLWFTRNCTFCKRYFCGVNPFQFDPELSTYPELELRFENFFFVFPYEDYHKIIILGNKNFSLTTIDPNPHSEISIWNGDKDSAKYDYPLPDGRIDFDVPLIPFVSVEETGTRLIRLLPFI